MTTWLFFGDDWGAHPSTTQHLARELGRQDRVVWVNSLGMRAPRPSLREISAITEKVRRRSAPHVQPHDAWAPDEVLSVPVVPLHRSPRVRELNKRLVARYVERALAAHAPDETVLVSSTPVASWYVDPARFARVIYLRLDDYAALPGVDPTLVAESEPRMREMADFVVGTARSLLEGEDRGLYLPQGVDVTHFARVPSEPAGSRVLGFFGLLAEWVNFDLIEQVADREHRWTLELLGPVRHLPDAVARHPRVRVRPAVPYAQLPEAVSHWDAAWIPFVVDELTRAVNPVKLREYVAAGLPTFSTPMPSACEVPQVTVGATSDEVSRWLGGVVTQDTRWQRQRRRSAMADHTWAARADELRRAAFATTRAA
jgi:hypothetical protein